MISKSVKLVGVSKIFRDKATGKTIPAVEDFSLEVKEGEFITLLGPSGCGKTTTLRMIAGFEVPDAGKIFIGDEEVTNKAPNLRDTSMVFQNYALFPHLSIGENIAYGLKIKKLPPKEIATKVKNIMELVGLKGLETTSPARLSGGQQQRVALARCLVNEPKVLLFDEPLSNLDAKMRVMMRQEIRKLQKRLSITSIYVTHDQEEAMSLSDRIVVMNKGKIEQIGTPQEIYDKPATIFVADFIGKANFLKGKLLGFKDNKAVCQIMEHILELSSFSLDLKAGDKVVLVARPEALKISNISEKGHFSGIISSISYVGYQVTYWISYEGGTLTVDVSNPKHEGIIEPGRKVGIIFPDDCGHILKDI